MVCNYVRGSGKRKYRCFTDEDLESALKAIQGGLSQAKASALFNVPRMQAAGRPPVLNQEEEQILVQTLAEVSKRGYPLTTMDISVMINKHLISKGEMKKDSRTTCNMPGSDLALQHEIP